MDIVSKANSSRSKETKDLKFRYEGVANKFKPNREVCERLAYMTPYWMPASLYFNMVEATRAYKRDVARIMVRHLMTFLSGGGRTLTGIDSVDRQLLELYHDIYECAKKNGEELVWTPF